MKKFLVLVCVALASFSIEAQIKTPQPSPSSTLMQTVGLTDVTVTYSRPAMRGRTIFGDLVPYDKLWRTGANKNTTIEFSTDVTIDGQELKAGSYAIFTKPGKTSWEVIFYSDTNNWGTPQKWDDSKVAAKTTVEVLTMPMDVESFMIVIDEISNDAATLGILWEKTYVGVKFEVPTDATVMQNIDKVLNGPGADDYYAAAVYYSSTDKDINKAKEFMDKAMAMTKEPAFWQLRQQSLIQAKAGDKKGAIATAKKSLAAAEKAGNADYVKMNKDSLKEWGGM
ncbi:DUF2911 domain-containing protein [Maribacter polysiphoniae]|uniref:DUF2911 domain-containing protein n=1 Tax=Maribacter polysiphoniae TaxID=429344 RepID=A0A316DW06_9FLAO|nr:DUF2911 domain-containing protein [Maribacter polysiphoniae]MBD1262545.1 DUF2911 domain-containing protein [Maribacter polysiphoniae]PWK21379.1 Protein of unknown function (DUF2911) [Maribacter polysiphoniae]